MSPINNNIGQPLRGLDEELAQRPFAASPRGGVESSVTGSHITPDDAPEEARDQFAGLGPFLEDDDATVFKAVHNLVLRQEQLAKNRKARDDYWTAVKQGYGAYFKLTKVPDQDRWRCEVEPGTDGGIRLSPVPNKAADLCNKIVETLMVDPPKASPKAENDSEEAEKAAEMAAEFLEQDGGEAGTRDARLFWEALDAATSNSAAFLHLWVDPRGGGSVPLQINAHPQAQDPTQPLLATDAMGNPLPTTDPILRYVVLGPDGEPQQFVTDPSQASPQWLPRIMVDRLGREHVRTYPETADVADATKIICLWYCTLDEAKRRWPDTVGQMSDEELGTLCDWTPPRYLQLLPKALRSRWKQSQSETGDPKGSSADERMLFFYCCYVRQTPMYPKGACVYLSGYNQGTVLGKDTLTASIPQPTGGTDERAMDIPVVQIDLILDADDGDPMGKALIERFGGASEALSMLGLAFQESLDINLHPAVFTPVTSPVTRDDVDNSRATGDHIQILSSQDQPFYEPARVLPAAFFEVASWLDEGMHSISGEEKAAQGSDSSKEVSGKARQIAVQRSTIALGRFQQAALSAWERYFRLKVQLCMARFGIPQQIRYEGEDGAYKQEWWTGVDFAKVTNVAIQPGTGTMMGPQEKVNYLTTLTQSGYLTPAQAARAAKPAYASALGIPPDKHQQRIERQVGTFLKGPPSDEWIAQARAYNQAKAVADQQNQQAQAEFQQAQAQQQPTQLSAGTVPAAPLQPPQPVPPTDPVSGQPLPAPWTPFDVLPMDDEPLIAAMRQERLGDLMATVRFTAQPPEWQQVVKDAYLAARNAVVAAQPPAALPKGVSIATSASAGDVGEAEFNATHPKATPQQVHLTVGHPPQQARGPRSIQLTNHLGEVSHAVIHDHQGAA